MDFKEIQHELKTQDNRITNQPIWVLYDHDKIPTTNNYSEEYVYIGDEGNEIGKTLEDVKKYCEHNNIEIPKDLDEGDFDYWIEGNECISKMYYRKIQVFKQIFFTEKAAQAHLEQNYYHFTEPLIYVHSVWRNPEMIAIRKALMEGRVLEEENGERNN